MYTDCTYKTTRSLQLEHSPIDDLGMGPGDQVTVGQLAKDELLLERPVSSPEPEAEAKQLNSTDMLTARFPRPPQCLYSYYFCIRCLCTAERKAHQLWPCHEKQISSVPAQQAAPAHCGGSLFTFGLMLRLHSSEVALVKKRVAVAKAIIPTNTVCRSDCLLLTTVQTQHDHAQAKMPTLYTIVYNCRRTKTNICQKFRRCL